MKVSVPALSIFMLMTVSSPASSVPMSLTAPISCCLSFIRQQIPRKFVTDYYETNSLCAQPAVVFLTKRGRQVCANPADAWMQSYVEDLKWRVSDA